MTLRAQTPAQFRQISRPAHPTFTSDIATRLVAMTTHQQPIFLPPCQDGPLALSGHRWGVVLFHGFTGGPTAVAPWGAALAAAGATVSIPLLSGHGTTVNDLAGTTAGQWRHDVAHAVAELRKEDVQYVAVGGLSMGGALALDASAHVQPDATLVVNPALTLNPWDTAGALVSPLLKGLIPSVGPIAGDIKKPGVQEFAYDRTPVAAVEELFKLFRTVRTVLPRILGPVTLYWSPEDHIVPASTKRLLERNIPQLTTVVLDDSYHVATLDHDADRIFQDSINRLRSISGGMRARS